MTKQGVLKVETNRSGYFTFEIGLDFSNLDVLGQLAEHAYARFASMPKVGDIANQLERMSIVTSVHSTDTIEGGELTEEETADALNLDPAAVQKDSDQRVVNLRKAYELAELFSNSLPENIGDDVSLSIPGSLSLKIKDCMITDLHRIITANLEHEDNIPGEFRDNPKTRKTQVGDKEHGGVYTPPKCLIDIELLMKAFIFWANSEPVVSLPPLYRAPLLHYYFERIHPFWDGNGRTGRVIEAVVLQAANYKYAPYSNAKFYLDNIDTYFTLFNLCRKNAIKGEKYPNTAFVKFHLTAMLTTVNRLQDTANNIISELLFDANINYLHTKNKINDRQHAIIYQLTANPSLGNKGGLATQPWYVSLYRNLTNKTRIRDINKLVELGLVERSKDGNVIIKYAQPGIKLSDSPITTIQYT